MVKSLTIKIIQNFRIDSMENLNDDLGSIRRTDQTLTFNNTSFDVYECIFNHNFQDDIVVNLEDGTDYAVTQYKKVRQFKGYYDRNNSLFFIEAPNKVANAFISKLKKDLDITIDNFSFNFLDIIQKRNTTKVFNFKVEDINIDNKTFNGADVERNTEVLRALDEDRGTYMLVSMDVANIQKSIGFSKRGVIVIQNKLYTSDNKPYPYLQCAHDILLNIEAI